MKLTNLNFEKIYSKYGKTTLTKKEVALEMSISQTTLNRLIYKGECPVSYTQLGNKYIFTVKSVAEYISAIDLLAA